MEAERPTMWGMTRTLPIKHVVWRRGTAPDIRRVRTPVRMVYDWDSKEAACYRLYFEENRSLDEVIRYMKDFHNFTPR